MPKYIVKEGIIDRFLQKIFAKAAAKGQSRVINKLSKKADIVKFQSNFQ